MLIQKVVQRKDDKILYYILVVYSFVVDACMAILFPLSYQVSSLFSPVACFSLCISSWQCRITVSLDITDMILFLQLPCVCV